MAAASRAADRLNEFGPRSNDIDRVDRALRSVLNHVPYAAQRAAVRSFHQLTGPNWSLEWNLPRWLAPAIGLSPRCLHEITMANGLGLLALRIADDLADGDLAPVPGLAELSSELLERAGGLLLGWIPASDPYWLEHQRTIQDWQRGHGSARQFPDPSPSIPTDLSSAGAPLYLCARALCTIGRRPAWVPPLQRSLHHYLTACALIDHVKDWPADLKAGRPNSFLQRLAGRDGWRGEGRMAARAWSSMASGPEFEEQVAAAASHLERSARLAERLPPTRLPDYLNTLRQHTLEGAAETRARARAAFSNLEAKMLA